jgi:hypothetical protein
MAKFLTAIALVFAVLYAGEPDAEVRKVSPYRAKPEIILKNTPNGAELTYNGQLIKLGEMTMSDLEKILGKEYRFCDKWGDCWVWDELGVRAYSKWFKEEADRDKNITTTLSVITNQTPPLFSSGSKFTDLELPGNGIHPKELFKGYLEIDGIRIRKNMTIKALNAQLKTIRPFYCGQISICSTSIGTGDMWMWIGIRRDTEGRRYNSLIYGVEFTKNDTD